jgi:hypothetical protein
MRTLAVASVFGLFVISHSAAAQDRKPQPASPAPSTSSQAATGQESETQAAERKKVEELAKARQRRMDRLSRSVCSGC